MSYVLGVDLGTTFTAAAVLRDGVAQIASLGSRGAAIPSVVLLRDDETVLTGEAAERRAMTEPSRVAREFKRRLGDQTPILLAGTPYSAEALMSRLLRQVVADVASREGGPPDSITVTHPANWGNYKIDLLNQAIRIADVGAPVTLISEPEAAAISYASQQRLEVGEVIAVFDLGGGTFDAAVLRRTADGFEILGEPEGIERLGGIDFDAAVFSHVARTVGDSLAELDEDDANAQNAVARLRADCVQAKEALSADTDASIPVMLPNLSTEVRLTRVEFESMIRPPLVDATEALRRALRSAGVEPEDVSAVLLVGGSSRIPLVAQLVGAEFGRPVAVDAHPKHAIAIGAAYAAGAGTQSFEAAAPSPAAASPTPPPTITTSTVPPATAAAVPAAAAPEPTPTPEPAAPEPTNSTPEVAAASSGGAPPSLPPSEAPAVAPGAPGDGGDKKSPPWVLIAAVVLLIVIVGGAAFALSGGGDDPTDVAGDDTENADDDTTEDDATAEEDTTSTATPETTTSTTTTTTTTIAPDEDCAVAQALDRWVCLSAVRIEGSELVIDYTGEFQGEALSTGSGVHLHVYGNDVEAVNAGSGGPNSGSWRVIQSTSEIRLAVDDSILANSPDKVCALVADARAERVGSAHNYYDPTNGNCLPLPTA